MDWGFKTVFFTDSNAVNSNKSHDSIFKGAREERPERNPLREQERFFFIIWHNNNLYSDSTEHTLHFGFKNGLQTKTRHRFKQGGYRSKQRRHRSKHRKKAFFTVWQTLSFQSREYAAEGGRAPTIWPESWTSICIECEPFFCSMSLLKMKT